MAHATDSGCRRKLIVAAIDLGTTYSGYAFSFFNEYKEDPMIVHTPSKWIAGSSGLMSLNTPTVLLLNPDLSFKAFGYEAEDEYMQLAEDDEHHEYHYFRRFKMMLYNSRDPTIVHLPRQWTAGPTAPMLLKTPTVLLMNPDLTFNSFGYEAENAYSELAEDNEHEGNHYFRRFKMMLYNSRGLKRDMLIEDTNKRKVKALTVFAMSIKYLKAHMMGILTNRIKNMADADVHWVLTVPAIWNDGSKQFMREAAEMAGIKRKNLDIALEPDAASLWCMHLPVGKMDIQGQITDSMKGSPFVKGTKYMVVDIGGEKVILTLYEVVDAGKLKELDHASGGECGGTRVDASFEKFLKDIVGPSIFDIFQKKCPDDYIDLYREFETKKRMVQTKKTGRDVIRIPARLFDIYADETARKGQEKSITDRLSEIKEFDGKVALRGNKIRLDMDIVRSWFDESCKNSVEHVKKLFKSKSSKGVNTLLLVGGFSESQILQEALKSTFKDKRLIIPEDAGHVVLKGAVLYGHNPLTIVSRIAKCSYGVRVFRDFNADVHPENKKVKVGKRVKCKDVFAKHVTKGQELVIDEAQSRERYTPLEADQVSLVFDVYTSTEEEPLFVTDVDCTYVGQLEVEVPDTTDGKNRGVIVSMIFGGTEIRVEGKVEKTGAVTKASFDFLQ